MTSLFESEPSQDSQFSQDQVELIGEEGPNPTIYGFSGEKFELHNLRGKVTLLTFWASWCGPCQVELPTLKTLHEKLEKKGLSIVAINVDQDDVGISYLKHFWSQMELPFDSFRDSKDLAMKDFKVDILPANYILDQHGQVAIVANGANDWSHPQNIGLIEELLKDGQ